jgi:hypothetical protein
MTEMIHHASETDRIRANTSQTVNDRLDNMTKARLRESTRDPEGTLVQRLGDVRREWDFERVLETESSLMALTGLALAVALDKRFLLIPGFVSGMVLLHAVQGWYPLLPVFRRLGIRSQEEIDGEQFALKSLRGDFAGIEAEGDAASRAEAAWRAVLA